MGAASPYPVICGLSTTCRAAVVVGSGPCARGRTSVSDTGVPDLVTTDGVERVSLSLADLAVNLGGPLVGQRLGWGDVALVHAERLLAAQPILDGGTPVVDLAPDEKVRRPRAAFPALPSFVAVRDPQHVEELPSVDPLAFGVGHRHPPLACGGRCRVRTPASPNRSGASGRVWQWVGGNDRDRGG